jgi:hypothetical protein
VNAKAKPLSNSFFILFGFDWLLIGLVRIGDFGNASLWANVDIAKQKVGVDFKKK